MAPSGSVSAVVSWRLVSSLTHHPITVGLDAFTAHKVVEILADLAANGKTVILSIHQVG